MPHDLSAEGGKIPSSLEECNPVQCFIFFFQAEDGIRDTSVTGVQTCALPIQAEDGIRDTSVTGVQTCALPICKEKGPKRFMPGGFPQWKKVDSAPHHHGFHFAQQFPQFASGGMESAQLHQQLGGFLRVSQPEMSHRQERGVNLRPTLAEILAML